MSRYTFFFISNWRSGDLPEIKQQTCGLIRAFFRGAVSASLSELFALPAYPLSYWYKRLHGGGSGTPIVLVHGLFHNASAWILLYQRLCQAGFTNVYTYQYNTFKISFDEAVDGLAAKLEDIYSDCPHSRPILIGHSLGGAVCRAVAGRNAFINRLAGLVTLGTPHGGSDLAWFGGNRMSRSLIPGRTVSSAMTLVSDPSCPKMSIYTMVDDFVMPLSKLKTGRERWEERICAPMGHVWMLYSSEVATMILAFLRRCGHL